MIEQRFSAAAETYDRHARPQLSLAQSVCDILPEIYPDEILELGSGTGQLTRLLAGRFPDVPMDAVDISGKMVAHSQQKFLKFPQIRWIQADAQTYRGKYPYPLVISSSALHWVSDLQKTFENIFECMEPDGLFALGMMLRGTLKELQSVRCEIAPNKTPAGRLPSYEEMEAALHAAGFKIQRKKRSEEQVMYDDAHSFLNAIHEQGVTGGRIGTGGAPLTRRELQQLINRYQEQYRSDDGVYATYETATFLMTRNK